MYAKRDAIADLKRRVALAQQMARAANCDEEAAGREVITEFKSAHGYSDGAVVPAAVKDMIAQAEANYPKSLA